MQPVVPDPDVGALVPRPQLDVADAALEAAEVVEQAKALDYHGGAATWRKRKQEFVIQKFF